MKSACRKAWRIAGRCSFLLAAVLSAQPGPVSPGTAAKTWHQARQREILAEYFDLLRLPNVAADTVNIRRNAEFIAAMYRKRGVATELLEVPGAPPVVFGEIRTPGATQTLVFYAHYDGQPVDPKQWTVTQPWTPMIKDGRIYARASADDKAPIQMIASALDALQAARTPPRSNLKFFFEGEEEAGSPHVAAFLNKFKSKLDGDVWMFCDGPQHQSRQDQIVFGTRGVVGLNITLYGPKKELHSGHYGNWAPNPAQMLVNLMASMRDDEGRVLIADFYKGVTPLTESEKAAIARMPDVATGLRQELALGRTLGDGQRLELLVNQPVLNLRGIASAAVGAESRNVVPSTATASLDIRLVKGVTAADTLERVRAHVRKQGYFVVDRDPDEATLMAHPKVAKLAAEEGYNAVRTSMELPIAKKVVAAVEAARGPVIQMPTLGGSLPMALFEEILRRPLIIVPTVNHDNNQHSHNENLKLENLWAGIETMAALLAMN